MTGKGFDTTAGDPAKYNDQYLEEYEGISLKDMALSLWGYRTIIVALTLVAALLIGGIGAYAYLLQKKQDITRLRFRLDFDGVEKNQYPNGGKFSTSDLLATPVINSVYDANDLKRYLSLAEFRSSLAVLQSNDKVRLLEYEYAAKLDDRKLSVDQRSRLEAEFLEKKKNLMVPIFDLVLSGGSNVLSIPPTLRSKVLQDILSGWAEYADRVKGANKYQISLVSKNILSKEELEAEDYLVVVDMLRVAISRIVNDLDKLREIPGSANFRLQGSGVSLSDLKYRLQDVDKFKVSPLLGIIRLGGITKSDDVTKVYLQHCVFELKMKEEDATARERVYESSLANYGQGRRSVLDGIDGGAGAVAGSASNPLIPGVPTTIPQLGETFLNSIVKMARENLDAKFRQEITQNLIKEALEKVVISSDLKFYERLLSELAASASQGGGSSVISTVRSKVVSTVEQVYKSIMQSIDELNAIYNGLSKASLNPSGTLFTVTEPVIISQDRSLTLKKAAVYVVLAWVLVEGFILIGVLIANSFRRKEE